MIYVHGLNKDANGLAINGLLVSGDHTPRANSSFLPARTNGIQLNMRRLSAGDIVVQFGKRLSTLGPLRLLPPVRVGSSGCVDVRAIAPIFAFHLNTIEMMALSGWSLFWQTAGNRRCVGDEIVDVPRRFVLGGGIPSLLPPGCSAAVEGEDVTVSWNPVEGATGFEVFLYSGEECIGEILMSSGNLAPSTTEYTFFGLSPGLYAVKVVAYGDGTTTLDSSSCCTFEIEGSGLEALPPPVPADCESELINPYPTLSWSQVPNNNGYLVELFNNEDCAEEPIWSNETEVNQNSTMVPPGVIEDISVGHSWHVSAKGDGVEFDGSPFSACCVLFGVEPIGEGCNTSEMQTIIPDCEGCPDDVGCAFAVQFDTDVVGSCFDYMSDPSFGFVCVGEGQFEWDGKPETRIYKVGDDWYIDLMCEDGVTLGFRGIKIENFYGPADNPSGRYERVAGTTRLTEVCVDINLAASWRWSALQGATYRIKDYVSNMFDFSICTDAPPCVEPCDNWNGDFRFVDADDNGSTWSPHTDDGEGISGRFLKHGESFIRLEPGEFNRLVIKTTCDDCGDPDERGEVAYVPVDVDVDPGGSLASSRCTPCGMWEKIYESGCSNAAPDTIEIERVS